MVTLMLISLAATAQKADSISIVQTKDGQLIKGKIVSANDSVIIIFNEILGNIKIDVADTITTSQNTSEESIRYQIEERFLPPVLSVNFITETAYPVGEGDYTYQNLLLFSQKIGYGATDRLSLYGGFELYSPIFQSSAPALMFSPKVSLLKKDKTIQMAVGANVFIIPDDRIYYFGSTVYSVVTIGNPDFNVSGGVGFLMGGTEISDTPIFQLGTQARLSNHFAFVYDGLIFDDLDQFQLAGTMMLRYMSRRVVVDLGIVHGLDDSVVIPMYNFAMKF